MTNTEALRRAIVGIASAEVGVLEEGGNNSGARVRLYQGATWLDPAPWPWCAAFTAWVLQQAVLQPFGVDYCRARKIDPNTFRCRDASAFGWLKWAERQGLMVFDEHARIAPLAGDFVVFDFSHIGIVAADAGPNATRIDTIEGNTAPKTTQRDGNDDGVYRMNRAVSLVRGYIRL